MPARVLALQRRGNDLEDQVLDSIRAYFPDTKVHIPTLKSRFSTVFPDGSIDHFLVAGRPDAILYNNILEVKSVGVEVFNTYRSEASLPQRFRDQLLLYGDMFGRHSLVVILVCRDDHRHRVYSVAPDPDRVLFLLARLGVINRALIDGIAPERDTYEQCPIYCPCWSSTGYPGGQSEYGKEASVGDSPETPYSVSGTGEAAGRSDSSGNEVGTLRPNSNSEIEETVHERVPEVPVLFRGAPITWDRSPKEQ